MNVKKKDYTCSYCYQTGGEHLGFTVDGYEVCSKCGKGVTINGEIVFEHLPEWDFFSDITTHRR